ncbi:MAG: FtsX-like permease family protein [Roseococcus sp.]
MNWDALPFSTKLAIRQLRHIGLRLIGTFSGVCVAVVLVFVQLGFNTALIGSVQNLPAALAGSVFLTGPQFETLITNPPWFQRSLLYEARAVTGVEDARPFYAVLNQVRNTESGAATVVRFMAFDPAQPVFDQADFNAALPWLALPRTAILDRRSRRNFGPLIDRLSARRLEDAGEERVYLQIHTAVLAPEMRVLGLYRLGPDFTIDGSFTMGHLTYSSYFQYPLDRVAIGVVRIAAGEQPAIVRDRLAAALGDRARVYTKDDLLRSERNYLLFQTPMGVVLGFGMIVGVFIGAVFVLQVLHNIIDANLSEYAVLRAMGYGDGFFIGLVLQIAVLIGVGAFIPSVGVTALIYLLAENVTKLTFALTPMSVTTVLAASLIMSGVAALFAIGKLRRSNPIELFA